MSAPREETDEPKGLVLPFRRRETPQARRETPQAQRDKPRPHGNAPVEGLEKYAETSEPDDYRRRMINNVLALVFCVVLVGAGVWIADRIAEMRKNQDCVLSGRRNCANVTVPPVGPMREM